MPAQRLLDPKRLQRDARTEAARRIQASRDVMAVLDTLEASRATTGIQTGISVEDVRAGKEPSECTQMLVVLFVHNISPLETL